MSDTPTPITDAHTIEIVPVDDVHYSVAYCPNGSGKFVEADRMLQLERDLAAARAEAARLREAMTYISQACVSWPDCMRCADEALAAPVAAPAERVCRWTVDDDGVWATSCRNAFVCETGTPSENKFKCCPYCGGKIDEVRT